MTAKKTGKKKERTKNGQGKAGGGKGQKSCKSGNWKARK